MYNSNELEQRLEIIKNSDITDVKILDRYYTNGIRYSVTSKEQEQFAVLHCEASDRIKTLVGN